MISTIKEFLNKMNDLHEIGENLKRKENKEDHEKLKNMILSWSIPEPLHIIFEKNPEYDEAAIIDLRERRKNNKKENKYKCTHENCEKAYRSRETLKVHMNTKHLKTKIYKCRFCTLTYSGFYSNYYLFMLYILNRPNCSREVSTY
jgi:hypothetical protein